MINFMRFNSKMITISIILMISSIALVCTKGFNFSIDFTGGTLTEIHFESDIDTDEVKNILLKEFKEVSVIHYGSSKNVVIQTPLEDDYKGAGDKIYNSIKSVKSDATKIRTEFIGPKVGEELKTNGILALLIVTIGVLIYISISFEFKYAIGAVIALTHDLVLAAGFISLTQLNVDLTVLAAMLAILGYSLNDTIVVYDRIRENIESVEKVELNDIVNNSVNETLSRTIMTSLTTSVTLVSLLVFGGESLFSFSNVLLFGVVVGTYSSIYIASGILLYLDLEKESKVEVKTDREGGVV